MGRPNRFLEPWCNVLSASRFLWCCHVFKFDYNKSRDMVHKGWKCIFDFSSILRGKLNLKQCCFRTTLKSMCISIYGEILWNALEEETEQSKNIRQLMSATENDFWEVMYRNECVCVCVWQLWWDVTQCHCFYRQEFQDTNWWQTGCCVGFLSLQTFTFIATLPLLNCSCCAIYLKFWSINSEWKCSYKEARIVFAVSALQVRRNIVKSTKDARLSQRNCWTTGGKKNTDVNAMQFGSSSYSFQFNTNIRGKCIHLLHIH